VTPKETISRRGGFDYDTEGIEIEKRDPKEKKAKNVRRARVVDSFSYGAEGMRLRYKMSKSL
jgi:hypothetical protein